MKKVLLFILILLCTNCLFAAILDNGEIINIKDKKITKITATGVVDTYVPCVNGVPIANDLFMDSSVTINSNKTGKYTLVEQFQNKDLWKKKVYSFTGDDEANLYIGQGGDLGDGALISKNGPSEDTLIYLIDPRFYPIKGVSISGRSIDVGDVDVLISDDLKDWSKLGTINTPNWSFKDNKVYTKPIFVKFFNHRENHWLCLLDFKVEADFAIEKEKQVYYDSINMPDWQKNFDEVYSDLDVLRYSGNNGFICGDGNATNQYVTKSIKMSSKAENIDINFTTIYSQLTFSISTNKTDWFKVGTNNTGDSILAMNYMKVDADTLKEVNKTFNGTYYIKISKGGNKWFALSNYMVTFDLPVPNIFFSKLKNNLRFTSSNDGKVDLIF